MVSTGRIYRHSGSSRSISYIPVSLKQDHTQPSRKKTVDIQSLGPNKLRDPNSNLCALYRCNAVAI